MVELPFQQTVGQFPVRTTGGFGLGSQALRFWSETLMRRRLLGDAPEQNTSGGKFWVGIELQLNREKAAVWLRREKPDGGPMKAAASQRLPPQKAKCVKAVSGLL